MRRIWNGEAALMLGTVIIGAFGDGSVGGRGLLEACVAAPAAQDFQSRADRTKPHPEGTRG